jgi:F420H(2)-dependent quinone reductase
MPAVRAQPLSRVPPMPDTAGATALTSPDLSPRMRRQATIINAANVVMRRVLALPFPPPLGRSLMLLTVTGRRTGKVYRQPISYVRNRQTLLTPGGGRWTLNLAPDRPVLLRIRGNDKTAIPDLIRAPDEVAELLTVIATSNPSATRFMPIPFDAAHRPDRTAVAEATSHGFCIVRWYLTPPGACA